MPCMRQGLPLSITGVMQQGGMHAPALRRVPHLMGRLCLPRAYVPLGGPHQRLLHPDDGS